MTTSVTKSCFTKQHQTCKPKTKTGWSQTGLVLRPTVSDHITAARPTSSLPNVTAQTSKEDISLCKRQLIRDLFDRISTLKLRAGFKCFTTWTITASDNVSLNEPFKRHPISWDNDCYYNSYTCTRIDLRSLTIQKRIEHIRISTAHGHKLGQYRRPVV